MTILNLENKTENDIGLREFDRLIGNRALIKSSYSTVLCIYYRGSVEQEEVIRNDMVCTGGTCGIYADANTPSFGTCLWLETYLKYDTALFIMDYDSLVLEQS